MIIAISGSRYWGSQNHIFLINQILSRYPFSELRVLVGDCRGVDAITLQLCKQQGIDVKVFCADWKQYGAAAGPIRNSQILDSHPTKVYCFTSDLQNSLGTKNMWSQARKRGIDVEVITD